MNLGIDIDDTITNSSEIFIKYAKIYNKKNDINYKINKFELDQKKAFGWSVDNQKEFANQYIKRILSEAKPNKKVVETLKILKEKGYNIFFITARKDSEVQNIYDFTRDWLIKNNIIFDKLIVNCDNKLKECINNNIELFIDDNYQTCKKIIRFKKIKVLLYETNYNKKYKNKKIKKVDSWATILKLLIEDKENI